MKSLPSHLLPLACFIAWMPFAQGQDWQLNSLPFDNTSARLWNLHVSHDRLFLASLEGLYYTDDGATWTEATVQQQALSGVAGFFSGRRQYREHPGSDLSAAIQPAPREFRRGNLGTDG